MAAPARVPALPDIKREPRQVAAPARIPALPDIKEETRQVAGF